MPSASKEVLGQFKRLYVSADNVTWTRVGKLINVTLPRSRSIVQANNTSNLQNVKKLPSRKDNKLSGACHDDYLDAGQALLRQYSDNGLPLYFKYLPYAAIGRRKNMGVGYVVTESDNDPDDQAETLDWAIEIDGSVTGSNPTDPTVDANDIADDVAA